MFIGGTEYELNVLAGRHSGGELARPGPGGDYQPVPVPGRCVVAVAAQLRDVAVDLCECPRVRVELALRDDAG